MSAQETTQDRPAPALQLHIERIVIDGVPLSRAQAGQLRGALQTELERLLQTGARTEWQGAALHSLSAPAVMVSAPVQPLELGRLIARSVHASLIRDT